MKSSARWRVKTPASGYVVDLDDLKAHLRIEADHENTSLLWYIDEARDWIEDYTHHALLDTVFEEYLDGFADSIILTWAVTQSVDVIEYLDDDGNWQTANSDIYAVDPTWERGIIYRLPEQEWPTPKRVPNSVRITYTAGFGTNDSAIPARYKALVRKYAGFLYENREASEFASIQKQTLFLRSFENEVHSLMNRDLV